MTGRGFINQGSGLGLGVWAFRGEAWGHWDVVTEPIVVLGSRVLGFSI